jgi:hypothetical protein
LPALAAPDLVYRTPLDLEQVQQTCETAEDEVAGEACVALGHIAMHPDSGAAAPDEAARRYRQGCDVGNAVACFALGYLQRKAALPAEAYDYNLMKACRARSPAIHACWARYAARIEDVPDPTAYPGRRSLFRAERPVADRHDELVFNSMAGVSPDQGYPVYGELGIAGMFDTASSRVFVDLRSGLRLRTYRQRDTDTQVTSSKLQAGIGAGVGLALRPLEDAHATVSLGFRGCLYYPLDVGYGPAMTMSYEVGHRMFEIGVLIDQVPVQAHQLTTLGRVQVIETQHTTSILTLSYGFVTAP